MPVTVTADEILAAIHATQQESPSQAGFTMSELADAMGVTMVTARKRLVPLVKAGKCEPVRLMRRFLDGRMCPVGGFRMVG